MLLCFCFKPWLTLLLIAEGICFINDDIFLVISNAGVSAASAVDK